MSGNGTRFEGLVRGTNIFKAPKPLAAKGSAMFKGGSFGVAFLFYMIEFLAKILECPNKWNQKKTIDTELVVQFVVM